MNFEQIAAALEGAGYTWSSAAEAIGKSRAALVRVSKREIKSRYIAKAICALLNRPLLDVFGDVPEYAQPTPAERRQEVLKRARAQLRACGVKVQAA